MLPIKMSRNTTTTETVSVSQVFPTHNCHFSFRWAALKIDSLEAEAVAALWFKDPTQGLGVRKQKLENAKNGDIFFVVNYMTAFVLIIYSETLL